MIWPDGMFYNADVIGPWVVKRGGGRYVPGLCTAIGRVKGGQIVAGVLYEQYNGANVWCHIAGEGKQWLNRKMLGQMFDYPFNQLGVRRITVPVASNNKQAQRFVEKLGFELEATLDAANPDSDVLIYRMTREHCIYIGGRYG